MKYQSYLDSFIEMIRLRNLTDHTIHAYCTYISAYLQYCENIIAKSPEDVSWAELREFIRFIQKERNLSDRTMNGVISILRFFTLYVLHKLWDETQLPFRKFDSYIPFVPSKAETFDFIEGISDIRLKAIISLLYGSGLRIGEACALQYSDISRTNMQVHVRHSKNHFDRYAMLSARSLEILTQYWRECGQPTGWLFPAPYDHEKPVRTAVVGFWLKAYKDSSGKDSRFTFHTFRRAFATHMYEDGGDILAIKHYMGHRSIYSTAGYISLARAERARVASPFDVPEVRS